MRKTNNILLNIIGLTLICGVCFAQEPINDDCEDAILIECSTTVNGTLDEATFRDYYNGCSNENDPDVWYQLVGTGQLIDFEFVSGASNYLDIDILTNGCDFNQECIDDLRIYPGQNYSNRRFFAIDNTTYYIRVSAYCCETSEFSFHINCNDLISNDFCENAELITCGQTIISSTIFATADDLGSNCGSTRDANVWYRIIGTNQIVEININNLFSLNYQLYNSGCSGISSSCIADEFYGTSYTFFAELGQEYLLNIYDVFNEDFSVTFNCSGPILNDECESAVEIFCGDNISGSSQFLTENEINPGCQSYPDIWYKFSGTGDLLKFVYASSDSEYLSFEIYRNGCLATMPRCENTFALNIYTLSYTFITDPGSEYLIRLEPNSTNNYGYSFNFSIECLEEINNDRCENAIQLICGDQISGNLENASFTEDYDGCTYVYGNDLWYTFEGDGNLVELSILENETDQLNINIYNQTCSEEYFNCYDPIELYFDQYGYNQDSSAVFPTVSGVQYWLRVGDQSSDNPGEFSFIFTCIEAETNDVCVNAIAIECEGTYEANLAGASFSDSYNGCHSENRPDIWYTINGDGNIYSFEYLTSSFSNLSFRIYTGSCSQDFQCFKDFYLNSSNPTNQFLTALGQVYTILVFTYDEPGPFSFSVSCPSPIYGDLCSDPISLSCGSTETGNTKFATFGSDDAACYSSEVNNLWYEFFGTGDIWAFTYGSSVYDFIRFEVYEEDCSAAFGQCLVSFLLGPGSYANNVYNFPTQTGVKYYLKVELDDSSSGVDSNGEFEFSVDCIDGLVNDNCETATEIFCGDIVNGTNLGATFDLEGIPCTYYNMPNVWYKIIGTGGITQLTLNSSLTDKIEIQLSQNSCNEDSLICLDNYHLSTYNYSEAYFHTELDSIYYLNITLDYFDIDNVGEFSFTLTCLDLELNDDCTSAIPLNCFDEITGNTALATTEIENSCSSGDLWYSIEGDNALHIFEFISSNSGTIRFEVYEGSCDDLGEEIFVFYYSSNYDLLNRFFAYSGTTYLIRVTAGCGQSSGEFTFIHNCPDPYENDFCEDAVELVCDEEYSGSLELATIQYQDDICGYSYNVIRHDVWFAIEGDGLIYQFTDLLTHSNYTRISIFEATCDQDLSECAQNFDITNDFWNSFLAENGKSYLIRLYDQQNDPEFHFRVDCFTPATNDDCSNATPIACGDALEVDFTMASNMGLNDGCDDYETFVPDLWYMITGTDEYVTLSLDNPVSSTSIYLNLFENSCENLIVECPTNEYIYQNNSYSFFAESDSTYLIRFFEERNAQTIINVSCDAPQANDDCEDAIDISCGQTISGNTSFATSTMNFNGCFNETSSDVWYTIIGTGQIIEFELLFSPIDFLSINAYEESCGSTFTICNPHIALDHRYGREENGYFFAEDGVSYIFRVTLNFEQAGMFEFQINCLDPAENNTCEDAFPISCGDFVNGNSTNSSLSLDEISCYNSSDISDLWYYLEGDNLLYSFDYLFSSGYNGYFYIFPDICPVDGCGEYFIIEASAYDPDFFFAEEGTNYWISLPSEVDELGEFSYQLSCNQLAENDTCETATEISCDQTVTGSTSFALGTESYSAPDVWYTFIGTGDLVEFSLLFGSYSQIQLNIYSGNCGEDAVYHQELEIINNRNRYFLTQVGVVYFIKVTTGYSDRADFSFEMNCISPVENDTCEMATEISCGTTISANNSTASFNDDYNGCYFEEQPDLWYTIQGTGEIIEFVYNSSHSNSINFEVYEDSCADQFDTCIDDFNVNTNSVFTIFGQPGVSYLLRVYTNEYSEGGAFSFMINCQEAQPNNLCENPIPIECGSVIEGNTDFSGSQDLFPACVYNPQQADLWYELQGTDELYEFSYLYSSGNSIRMHIFSLNACDASNFSCLDVLYISYSSTANLFYAEAGVSYLIRVSTGDELGNNGAFSFEIGCYEPIENDLCTGAIEIVCGDQIEGTLDLATSYEITCIPNFYSDQPGLWYSFTSTGDNIYELIYTADFREEMWIFENNCSDLVCNDILNNQFNGDFLETIYLPEGQYYFYLTMDYGDNLDFSFEINCLEPLPNDLCESPLALSCGNSVTDSLFFATNYTNDLENCFYSFTGPGLWYSLDGTGDIIQIDITTSGNYPQLLILNSDCENLTCEAINYDTRNPLYFHTEESTNYLLYITSEYLSEQGEFTLSINCDYYGPSDPCSCNNDQSGNGTQDGTFSETISVNNSPFNFIWTIIDIVSLNGASLPTGISIGDNLIFNPETNNHELSFDHVDDSGYSINIAGPYGYGIQIDTFTISNICQYPEIDLSPIQPMYKYQFYNLTELISEINGLPGSFEFYLDGEPTSTINGFEMEVDEEHQLEIVFQGEYENNMSTDVLNPANPGCSTVADFTFMIVLPDDIPTLSEWGLICCFLLLTIIGVIGIRQKDYPIIVDGRQC